MTKAQWLFEYLALREKERDTNDLVVQSLKALRHVLISVLGLNLMADEKTVKDEDGEEIETFIPLSILTGRREVVEHMLESIQQEDATSDALEDDDFEKMSSAIAKGEDLGDMAPLFEIDESLEKKLNVWFTPDRESELRGLGVKITETNTDDVNHVELDIDHIKEKKIKQAVERRQALEQVEEQIKKEKENLKSKGMKVTFDDV